MEGNDGRMMFERPEQRRAMGNANSYNCDPPPSRAMKYIPSSFSEPFRESDMDRTPVGGGAVSGLLAALGGQAAAAATGGKRTRAPACDPYAVNGGGPPRGNGSVHHGGGGNGGGPGGGPPHPHPRRRGQRGGGGERHDGGPHQPPRDIHDVNKDCFIIPQGNLERFLPDGITVREKTNYVRFCKLHILGSIGFQWWILHLPTA